VACAGDCKTCSVTTTNCTSCKILNLEGNACVSNCTVGSIPISQICTTCTSPCATCSITLTNCTSCLGGLSPQKYLTANTCQQTCPNFTYPNSSTLTCASCVSPCSLCTAFSSCLSCATSFFLEGTNCVSNCSVSFTGVAGLCQACYQFLLDLQQRDLLLERNQQLCYKLQPWSIYRLFCSSLCRMY
jgi:proprotein convertase subtilisin/kexin type 5